MSDIDGAKKQVREILTWYERNIDKLTEEEVENMLIELDKLVPDPEYLDILDSYAYAQDGTRRPISIDEFIEKAFSYKPIITPPPSDKTG